MKTRFIQCLMIPVLLLLLGATAAAQEFTYKVEQDRLIGHRDGELIISPKGVEFRAKEEKDSHTWTYDDIKLFEILSPTRLRIQTYKDRKLYLGKDESVSFKIVEGQLDQNVSNFLRDRTTRPFVTSFVEEDRERASIAEIPVKHLHRFGGCEGLLTVYPEKLEFQSTTGHDSRSWRWTDIRSVGRTDIYRFDVETFEPQLGASSRSFHFLLKERMDDQVYDLIWSRVYRPAPLLRVAEEEQAKGVEQYLDALITRATIAADAAGIIKEADSYRSRAQEQLKINRHDEARKLLRQAGELIAAAAPDGDVKQEDPLLREYLRDITKELVALDGGFDPSSPPIDATQAYSSEPRVVAFLNYFQGRGRDRLETGRGRLASLRPMMAKIFREEGVPEWLISVGFVESTYSSNAHSPAAAHGIWQFIPGTGQRYGLKQTAWTDERSHPEKSTRAAARYLRDLHALFGDWPLALAAYNWGEGRVARITQRTGVRDFWTLANRGLMPQETVNYVPSVIAAAQLLFDEVAVK